MLLRQSILQHPPIGRRESVSELFGLVTLNLIWCILITISIKSIHRSITQFLDYKLYEKCLNIFYGYFCLWLKRVSFFQVVGESLWSKRGHYSPPRHSSVIVFELWSIKSTQTDFISSVNFKFNYVTEYLKISKDNIT